MKIFKILPILFLVCSLTACKTRQDTPLSSSLVSLQTLDRNGFSETISNKDRLQRFAQTDFLAPQPYQKVLRVFGRDQAGKSGSKITSYHANGQISQYLEIAEGRANGLYQEWHPNGILKINAHVIEGLGDVTDVAQMSWLFDGENSVWDEQGRLSAVFHYSKGVLEGMGVYYHPNGQVARSIPYIQDNIEGDILVFDEQGHQLEKVPFTQNKKQGIAEGKALDNSWGYREEYSDNQLQTSSYVCKNFDSLPGVVNGEGYQAIFKDGYLSNLVEIHRGRLAGSVRIFNPDGSLKSMCHVHNEKKHGEEWEYYPCAPARDALAIPPKPKVLVFWNEDTLQGITKTWYSNGVLESEREMNQNALHGLCAAYYKDGTLMLMEEYERGKLWKGSYFKKGDKQPVSRIEEGHGIATLYHGDGYFLRKTSYEKGMPLTHE